MVLRHLPGTEKFVVCFGVFLTLSIDIPHCTKMFKMWVLSSCTDGIICSQSLCSCNQEVASHTSQGIYRWVYMVAACSVTFDFVSKVSVI